MSHANVNGISLYYEEHDVLASPDLAAAVIPFLDAPSLEPPAPFGH